MPLQYFRPTARREFDGSFYVTPDDLPATHRRIVIRRPDKDKSVRDCSIEIFRKFATRAFRRPATADELARLADLVVPGIVGKSLSAQCTRVPPNYSVLLVDSGSCITSLLST